MKGKISRIKSDVRGWILSTEDGKERCFHVNHLAGYSSLTSELIGSEVTFNDACSNTQSIAAGGITCTDVAIV